MALRLHRRPQHDGRVAVHVDYSVARGDPAAGTPQVAAGHSGVFDVVVEHRCRIDAVMAGVRRAEPQGGDIAVFDVSSSPIRLTLSC